MPYTSEPLQSTDGSTVEVNDIGKLSTKDDDIKTLLSSILEELQDLNEFIKENVR
jgi:archaellum component FlaC